MVRGNSRSSSWEMIGGEKGEILNIEGRNLAMKGKEIDEVVARAGKEIWEFGVFNMGEYIGMLRKLTQRKERHWK